MHEKLINTLGDNDVDLMRSVLHGLEDGVIVANLEGKFLLFNPAAEKLLGLGAGNMTPDEWSSTYGCYLPDKVSPFPPEDLPLARALEGETIDGRLIFIKNQFKPSGLWISVSGRPLKSEDGSIWGGLAIFHDVTEHREAEDGFLSTSLWLSALIENQNTGILVENEKRQIQYINQAFCRLFDIPTEPSALLGIDCSQSAEQAKSLFLDPDGFVKRIEQLLNGKITVTNEKLHLNNGNILERDYIPVYAAGEYRGHVWQYRDITEEIEKRNRSRLIERLSRALEQTADSVVITDKKGHIEYVNQAFEKITGYTREDVVGRTPRILRSGKHNEDYYKKLWGTILSGNAYQGTIINRKKSGDLYWAEQTITPMKDGNGNITHYVSVLKDITELLKNKEQEVEMRLAREVQQLYYNAKASLPGFDIAGAAHPAYETGGDYFDFITIPNNCHGIIIGDVSGHGISSALVMAETRAYLRSFASVSSDAGVILSNINRALCSDLRNGRFVTLLVICLDIQNRVLNYASAGQEYGYLLNESGDMDAILESTGPPLGILQEHNYVCGKPISLSSNQTLLLVTDGLTDSMNSMDEQFGTERAINYVREHGNLDACRIAEGLCQASKSFAENQAPDDDVTSIILKVL